MFFLQLSKRLLLDPLDCRPFRKTNETHKPFFRKEGGVHAHTECCVESQICHDP